MTESVFYILSHIYVTHHESNNPLSNSVTISKDVEIQHGFFKTQWTGIHQI